MAWPAAVANDIVGMGTWRLKVRAVPCDCATWGLTRTRVSTPCKQFFAASRCARRTVPCGHATCRVTRAASASQPAASWAFDKSTRGVWRRDAARMPC